MRVGIKSLTEGMESREEDIERNKNKERLAGVERVGGNGRLGPPGRTGSPLVGFGRVLLFGNFIFKPVGATAEQQTGSDSELSLARKSGKAT